MELYGAGHKKKTIPEKNLFFHSKKNKNFHSQLRKLT